jgi:hypothetical protein
MLDVMLPYESVPFNIVLKITGYLSTSRARAVQVIQMCILNIKMMIYGCKKGIIITLVSTCI